jgi:hypothetical protein
MGFTEQGIGKMSYATHYHGYSHNHAVVPDGVPIDACQAIFQNKIVEV